jgi:hypothetical protein
VTGQLALLPRPRTLVAPAEMQLAALIRSPLLWELGALVPPADTGRPRRTPMWAYLMFGAAARIFRSAARAEAELATPHLRALVAEEAHAMRTQLPDEWWAPSPPVPIRATAFEAARQHTLCDPDTLVSLMGTFTDRAVGRAQSVLGLLLPDGLGSWTHPDRSRCIFGDGTLIRSLYRPPATEWVRDPSGGQVLRYRSRDGKELLEAPDRRYDPSIAEHHGKAGPVHGHNLVTVHATGRARLQRYLLGFGIAPAGHEADTGVALALQIARAAGPSAVQALVWDLAIRGVHADQLMTHGGLMVITRVAQPAGGGPDIPRSLPLGTAVHQVADRTCAHVLAAVDGQVSQVVLDERGDPHPRPLELRQVKRARRQARLTYHFTAAYTVTCRHGDFTTWISPHSAPGDPDHRRAENMRLFPPAGDVFDQIHGIREESESAHSLYKRSLLYDRAPYLGRDRLLLDQLCWALAHNALVEHRLRHLQINPRRLRRSR